MKVAITADVHLNSQKKEPLDNFKVIVQELLSKGISHLVVAGDLFDLGYDGHIEVDNLAKQFPELSLIAVPGNHDPNLDRSQFNARNVEILTQPTIKKLGSRRFLFLPYREGKTMGGTIEESGCAKELEANHWILISHGDFGSPRPDENGDETGYFPLTRQDIARYRPARVVLGHIHAPSSLEAEVVFPGSPYPRTANEWGQRRVLVLDTESGLPENMPLENPPVYLQAELFIVPDAREKDQIRRQLASFLQEAEKEYRGAGFSSHLVLSLVLRGYTTSREGIEQLIQALLAEKGVRINRIEDRKSVV